jgi:hypothetical protein
MKIQFLNGGLANQTFQYIFARYYELSHPGEIMYMDDSYFALNTVHNGYELDKVFGIKAHMLSECFDQDVWNFILEERRKGKSVPQILCENGIDMYMLSEVGDGYRTFNPFDGRVVSIHCNQYLPEVLDMPGDVYYHGYWIHKSWFRTYRANFLEELQFPEITDRQNRAYLNHIMETNSVSLHVRRGDYVKLGCAMNADAYQEVIGDFLKGTSEKWNLFVFSDDIHWCREHQEEMELGRFESVTFVEGNMEGRNYMDMQLMSKCKAMIMSNSAFCFLAALLNVDMKLYLNPIPREL